MNQATGGMLADRLAAFSDGVIAIIITIMVLELHAPETAESAALTHLLPIVSSYTLSFLLVAIYWVNHHHLLHSNRRVGRDVLWLNIHWLFWLSLFPFATAYVGNTHGAPIAVMLYAGIGTATAIAFRLLGVSLSRRNADNSVVSLIAPSRRRKNTFALLANVAAIPAATIWIPLAFMFLALPALFYFLPDARVETFE